MPTTLASRARVRDGDQVLADSQAAIRVERSGVAPELWMPRADVVPEGLDGGACRIGEGDLARHVCFDPDEVEVVLSEPEDGDDAVDVVRFPNWGDVSDLVEVMDVRPDGDLRYVSAPRADWRRPVVEGSQVLGQSIVAASRRAPGRRAVAVSMTFTRALDADAPYHLVLDPVADGRTFSAARTSALQGDRIGAFGTTLLDVTAPDVLRHDDPMPDVPGPDDSTPYDMGVTGRDLRVVDDAYTDDPDAPPGPPELSTWVRFRRLPDDQAVHAGLLAQYTGHMSIAAAMRPHAGIGQHQAHRTLSTAINAISLSIHAEVRADRWMLYHHRSTNASGGMTHSECRVYGEDRQLVASFSVVAMVRAFADPTREGDHRSAL
jgi:acyl-CoA thioesterase II